MFYTIFFISSLVLLAAGRPNPSITAQPTVNTDDPSQSNPTSPPSSISPLSRPPNPVPTGIPLQPEQCVGRNPSKNCFTSLSKEGGYLWFDKDSLCSSEQKSHIETSVWDASTLAFYSNTFANQGSGSRGISSAIYWMGPNWAAYQKRIAGNLRRAWEFKAPKTSSKEYITVSCNDKQKGSVQAVGGYSETVDGWFGSYHYITFCAPFFNADTLDQKTTQVEQDLAKGDTKMAANMPWLTTAGQMFLHELMHTKIATDDDQPFIGDEYVNVDKSRIKAYGAKYVHALAASPLSSGGGAQRASTNADSYAMLAKSIWWWDVTGYFLAAPPSKLDVPADILFPYVNLTSLSQLEAADASLFQTALEGYGPPSPKPSSTGPPTTTTPAQTAPIAIATDICGDWYEFLFDHFLIYGKHFNASPMGTDGSGLKSAISGCGDLTLWNFDTITNDPQGFQWKATGNLPIGTKSCVGDKVQDLGGDKSGCTGAG